MFYSNVGRLIFTYETNIKEESLEIPIKGIIY